MKRATASLRLSDIATGMPGFRTKKGCKKHLRKTVKVMQSLQDKLYAQQQHAVLIVFQAMDAAGKDGMIKHVMSGLNPQGCQVTSFKQPTSEETSHDFLWRVQGKLPVRGQIAIFNRSHYEEVLVVRVHPELLAKERVAASPKLWQRRYRRIRNTESHLAENGTVIIKFFLHMSKGEQKRRFLARLNNPDRNWKFSSSDLKERGCWRQYQKAYQEAIRATSTRSAPWYVIPADCKWYARMLVADIIVRTLKRIKPVYPSLDEVQAAELRQAKALLK
jgi:PPK2 family polyphosphate:nucleotide phosphotransferase